LVLAVLAAACSSGKADEAEPDPVVTLPDDAAPGGDNDGSGGGGRGADRTPTGSGGGSPTTASGRSTTTARSGATSTTARPSTTIPRQVDTGAKGDVGAYARHVLRPQGSERITVEILAQPGAAPAQSTLDHIARVLRDASGKTVSIPAPVALPAGDGTTNDTEIREWSDRYSRTAQTAEQAVLRLLFLTGQFEQTASVLGIAVRGDTAAVFKERVRQTATPPFVTVAQLEPAVTTHELGHLLGLVDLVIDTGRDDPENPGHSRNRGSVMYWAVESDVVSQVLDGPPPKDFDAADRDDLAAIRTS
jgi:hypothetical protein